ncbi:unnamed protein product, partial [Polarella glacialis]
AGRLRAVRAPDAVYATEGPPSRRDNVELAVVLMSAAAGTEYFMQVEQDAALQQGFLRVFRDYLARLAAEPWHMVSISKYG